MLLHMLYSFHQRKSFKNRLTADEVKADYT